MLVDYSYIDNYNDNDIKFLDNPWFKKNFIKITNIYINKNKISSIKYRDNKIIYNLCVSRTHEFLQEARQRQQSSWSGGCA